MPIAASATNARLMRSIPVTSFPAHVREPGVQPRSPHLAVLSRGTKPGGRHPIWGVACHDSTSHNGKDSMDPAAPHETIGERLRRVRIERGLTQRALACDGVSHAHISRIEAGTREASVKALRLLAARLGVSADYLERGTDPLGRPQIERDL